MSHDHRAVLVMRHYLDCSYRDIAEAVGVPESTVKSRLFEARRALRARLVSLGVIG
jgi:DNA-directed RNA polymerase specialized sigma subunit, sigma24 homolog